MLIHALIFLDLAKLHKSERGGGRGSDRRYSFIITNRGHKDIIHALMFLDLTFFHDSLPPFASANYVERGGGDGSDSTYSLIITNRVIRVPFMFIHVLIFLDLGRLHKSPRYSLIITNRFLLGTRKLCSKGSWVRGLKGGRPLDTAWYIYIEINKWIQICICMWIHKYIYMYIGSYALKALGWGDLRGGDP
jgi:hypothetical protein